MTGLHVAPVGGGGRLALHRTVAPGWAFSIETVEIIKIVQIWLILEMIYLHLVHCDWCTVKKIYLYQC